ncbi:hypothetical protein QVD17_12411 [Tagetes erecta]|uniref:Uncharacterized protein n=1 Tax=Tagetes erecta TaxID=13708 RepID=A0AAD8KYY6_TARER|nr:hypothetical protein QVD17_12411 [Tagetes erecta]
MLASQAQQVYYTSYPSKAKELKGWLAVVKTIPREIYELVANIMGRSSASGGRGRDTGRGIKDVKAHTFAKDDNGRDVIRGNNEDIMRRSFANGGRSWGTGRGINQDRTSHTFSKDDKGRKAIVKANSTSISKLNADKKLGREISFDEMWMQAHCKKGSRPLDKVSEGEGLGEGSDREENVHQDVWSDMRSFQTYEKYKAYVVEKDGDVGTLFYYDGWIQASGGMNKGKLYGLNNVSDMLALMTGIPSTECSSTSYEYGSESLEI